MHLHKRERKSSFFSEFLFQLSPQAECQSLRVNNCRQLIAEVGVEAVRRDNICKTQCSFALTSPVPVANLVQTAEGTLTAPLPPKRGGRDHPPHLPRPPVGSLRGPCPRPLHLLPEFLSGPDFLVPEHPSSQQDPQDQEVVLCHRVHLHRDHSHTGSLAPSSHSQAYGCQTSRTCLVSRGSRAQAGRPKCQNPQVGAHTSHCATSFIHHCWPE